MRELIAQRLHSFEEMFAQGGSQLGDRISERLSSFEAGIQQQRQ